MYLGLDWLLIALGFRVRMVVGVVVVFVFFCNKLCLHWSNTVGLVSSCMQTNRRCFSSGQLSQGLFQGELLTGVRTVKCLWIATQSKPFKTLSQSPPANFCHQWWAVTSGSSDENHAFPEGRLWSLVYPYLKPSASGYVLRWGLRLRQVSPCSQARSWGCSTSTQRWASDQIRGPDLHAKL